MRHTFSPAMHNAAFASKKINAVYLPFEVKPQNLKTVLRNATAFGICGLNVTIPHKSMCIRYLDELSKEAAFIGAVNTIAIKRNRLIGYNTDGLGFMQALKKDLKLTY